MSIKTGNLTHDQLLRTATFTVVIFSLVIFGAFMPLVISYYKKVERELMISGNLTDQSIQPLLSMDSKINWTDTNKIQRKTIFIHSLYADAFDNPTVFEYMFYHPENLDDE